MTDRSPPSLEEQIAWLRSWQKKRFVAGSPDDKMAAAILDTLIAARTHLLPTIPDGCVAEICYDNEETVVAAGKIGSRATREFRDLHPRVAVLAALAVIKEPSA